MSTQLRSAPQVRRADSGAQPPHLPYPTVPTNLPGVYSIAPFTSPDLRKATATELLREGSLILLPGSAASAAILRAWNGAL